jgi:PhzF family phenazine biosynthesis protein
VSQVIWQVDAFTNRAFGGNPAAVCLLEAPRDEGWMQDVAREMNLSETAFLVRNGDAFDLRWFTPSLEVDLCGHATLASAHVLWQTGVLQTSQQARFQTKSGLLTAERRGDWIELDFPATPAQACEAPAGLIESLGVAPLYVGRSVFDYLVEVESEDVVRRARPDFGLLATVPARGAIVTARSGSPEFDFVSRFFGPAAGINEDPVTGSAHACLGPFWGERLDKSELSAYQASARGGVLRVRVGDAGRAFIAGQAVTVLRADLLPPA